MIEQIEGIHKATSTIPKHRFTSQAFKSLSRMGLLLYGGALRLMGAAAYASTIFDFARNEIVVHSCKENKDRHNVANGYQGVSFRTYRGESKPASGRSQERARSGCFAECIGTEISEGGTRVGMAMGFSGSSTLHR
jgi:hypothetical protein